MVVTQHSDGTTTKEEEEEKDNKGVGWRGQG